MANIMGSLFGRPDTQKSTMDTIIGLQQQLRTLKKKEQFIQTKIDEDLRLAKANAVSNKPRATAALKRKRTNETQLEHMRGQQVQLEMHVNTLELAKLNAEMVAAIRKAADALKKIQSASGMSLAAVDETIPEIVEWNEVATEIVQLISNPVGASDMVGDELQRELEELKDEVLSERLKGADRVPLENPVGDVRGGLVAAAEDEEEVALCQLQAEMYM
ncbi:vacuolar-sorting protein SNF7 [Mycena maculata]|uniref:Vacuolar-sorting protein SNF7 n=1 Tax=Mycena maculata TaxID=230809 RepID=A0AAD7HV75_9AGAR|nr:vacuolar-sorting protein SNF7 [Mycena maculata]